MALWHDPLDELIDALEQTLPPIAKQPQIDWQASLTGCQMYMSAIMWGTPEEIDRIEDDPRVQAYFASLRPVITHDDAHSGTPEGNPKESKRR